MIGRVIVALNVGNSHVGYGIVEEAELAATGHVPTPSEDADFKLEMLFDELLGRGGGAAVDLEIIVASVVPHVTAALRDLAQRRGFRLIEADESTVPMPTRLDSAATAGHDRLVNAFAGARIYGAPAIVVDLGTATTFDVVAADGAFVGGAIAPGLGLGVDALAARTAQLPRVQMVLPPHAIGRNTVEAIQSGAVLGHVGMVTYLLRAISRQLDATPTVVLTGGLSAHPWASAIPGVSAIDPLLTLRGLALLHRELTGAHSVAPA
jgi:type III pantothenate kinase